MSVQVEPTENPGELYISWLPPVKETHNGVIMGYHVKAIPQNVGSGRALATYNIMFVSMSKQNDDLILIKIS